MKIYNENCITGMKRLDADSVDLIVTDPPYGMSFMGKKWDKALPPKEAFEEMCRVLKPGAFAFVMCAPRSDLQARMSILLEDAGFDISFTPIYWTYATGFPKAKNFKDGTYAGFQPKPAVEVIIVAMKPLNEKNYSLQKEANGHGITYLDNCRVNGRFPANLIVSDDSLNDGIERKSTGGTGKCKSGHYSGSVERNPFNYGDTGSYSRYFDLDAWFAIIPKPSKKEKNQGLESFDSKKVNDGRKAHVDNAFQRGETQRLNTHPTVKPIKLMSYLITLGSIEGHVILDPFMGSGTTMIAADMLNREGIGFEMEEEYFNIAEARINGARKTRTTGQDKESRPEDKTDEQSKPDGTRARQTSLPGY